MTQENLVEALAHAVAAGPDHTAIRSGGVVWTYADLWERSGRIAAGLLDRLALRPGDNGVMPF